MIEYINAIATVLLLFITVATLLGGRERLDLQRIWEGVEPLKNVLEFIGNLPRWLNYYNDLRANVQSLRDKADRLETRMDDLRMRVEDQEFQTGRSRKKEVDNWLSSVETKFNEVKAILEQVDRATNHFYQPLYQAWLGNQVEKKIQEVDYLYGLGVFENVLLCHAREATELVIRPLVGAAANSNIRMILGWLGDSNVTKIGVHGIEGIGKSAIMMHIYNQLLKKGTPNLYVYMIQVPEESIEYGLQSCIAKELGLDLQEEDVLKRAALLNRALGRRNFVLILDGLRRYFPMENVGIPLDATRGKVIITSRLFDVCRRIGCQESVAVDPLPRDVALELFKQKLELTSMLQPPVELLAVQVVEQCRGVAREIIKNAIDLKGVYDISVWERHLNDMLVRNV